MDSGSEFSCRSPQRHSIMTAKKTPGERSCGASGRLRQFAARCRRQKNPKKKVFRKSAFSTINSVRHHTITFLAQQGNNKKGGYPAGCCALSTCRIAAERRMPAPLSLFSSGCRPLSIRCTVRPAPSCPAGINKKIYIVIYFFNNEHIQQPFPDTPKTVSSKTYYHAYILCWTMHSPHNDVSFRKIMAVVSIKKHFHDAFEK